MLKTLKIFCFKTNFFNARLLWKQHWKREQDLRQKQKKALQEHLARSSMYPWYKTTWKLKELLGLELHGFVKWATIHYNTQLLVAGRGEDDPSWAKNLYESQLGLAANYIQRNRSRLFEWWCLRDGKRRWLTDEDMIEIDLGKPFDAVLKKKLKRELGIDIDPDKNYYTAGTPVINEDGTLNTPFIRKMKANFWLGRARFGTREEYVNHLR